MPAARSLLAGKRDQKLCTAGRCQGRRTQRPGASARCPRGAERPVLRPREGGGGPGLASGVPGGPTAGVRERGLLKRVRVPPKTVPDYRPEEPGFRILNLSRSPP